MIPPSAHNVSENVMGSVGNPYLTVPARKLRSFRLSERIVK